MEKVKTYFQHHWKTCLCFTQLLNGPTEIKLFVLKRVDESIDTYFIFAKASGQYYAGMISLKYTDLEFLTVA